MTRPPEPTDRHDDDLLAAEYVVGVQDLATRTAIERRLRNDPAFAALVQSWTNRLSPLNDAYPEAPAPDLLPRIEARLFPAPPRPSRLSALLSWGLTAAATLAVLIYLALTPIPPSFTATLTADAGDLRYEAVITQDKLTITRVSGPAAAPDRSHELWIIAGDNPPVSLGVLPDDQGVISLPGAGPGEVLAITEEQAGGSPDGKPHGPIVAAGTLSAST